MSFHDSSDPHSESAQNARCSSAIQDIPLTISSTSASARTTYKPPMKVEHWSSVRKRTLMQTEDRQLKNTEDISTGTMSRIDSFPLTIRTLTTPAPIRPPCSFTSHSETIYHTPMETWSIPSLIFLSNREADRRD
ncbi:MAG: hypothetical protein LQ348_005873 [Seirophora lacunosa]|nr:MAG: hypothetical protein LQ348_005873 [Seirophora lacunosa]